jgi:hypothetical protein
MPDDRLSHDSKHVSLMPELLATPVGATPVLAAAEPAVPGGFCGFSKPITLQFAVARAAGSLSPTPVTCSFVCWSNSLIHTLCKGTN